MARNALADLRESEARLRLVQEAAGIASFDWNMITGETHRSPEFITLHGMPADTPLDGGYSETWSSCLHPEDRDTVIARFREAIQQPGTFEIEYRIVRADNGETRWMQARARVESDENGKPIRVISAQSDITRQKETEFALRAAKERLEHRVSAVRTQRDDAEEVSREVSEQFRLLVQGVVDYALYLIDPLGRVTTWNAGAARIKGYTPEEIIGRHFSVFYTPEDRDAGEPADEQPDTGPEETIAGSVITVRPDYATNLQTVSYCYSPDEASDCHEAPAHPVHFLYLRTAPDAMSPVIDNPYLTAWPGDRMFNWGNKVGTGTRWVRAERRGDWDAIYFSGQKAWFYNPGRQNTRQARGAQVTPRAGLAKIPVFGVGYPQPAAFLPPRTPVAMEQTYEIAAGQRYLVMQRFSADYYWAKTYVAKDKYGPGSGQTVIMDGTEYYLIHFNHREGLVRVADVDLIPAAP